jgi:hypothetical protein
MSETSNAFCELMRIILEYPQRTRMMKHPPHIFG